MRVELPSLVALRDVDLRQIADTCDLDVVRCLYEVNALQRAVRNGTCTATRLGAPGDLFTLGVADGPW